MDILAILLSRLSEAAQLQTLVRAQVPVPVLVQDRPLLCPSLLATAFHRSARLVVQNSYFTSLPHYITVANSSSGPSHRQILPAKVDTVESESRASRIL